MTDALATPSEEPLEPVDSTDPRVAPAEESGADTSVDNPGDNSADSVDEPVETSETSEAPEAPETPGTPEGDSAAAEESPSSARRVEEEGDIAADYVEELLDISDLDGDIDIEVRNGRTYVSVIAEEGDDRLRDLVGRDGQGLEALQELVRLTVLSATGVRSRLVLDVAGHRAGRAKELEVVAQEAMDSVRENGEPVHLKPMGAYERKVVHDVISAAEMNSESEGEGARRHVVVSAGE